MTFPKIEVFNAPLSTLISRLKSFRSNTLLRRRIRKFALALPLLALLFLLLISKKENPISIPQENPQKTIGWKEYKNETFRFSFKYPEGQLSDFNEEAGGISTLKNIQDVKENNSKRKIDPNIYNVKFGADAWKYIGSIEDFLEKKMIDTNDFKREKIILGKTTGLRVSNLEKKSDIYYQNNFFKNGEHIYSFSLFSDDPVLIRGNQQLLNSIISSAKFY